MVSKITAVIVEDEPSAREALRSYLSKYCPQVEVVAEAQDAHQAAEVLHATRPQLVFLDVEMPFGNAFDVLDACRDLRFETIFVTAFSEYSLQALNQSAAYYLLKPISIEELIVAVEKVCGHLRNRELLDRNSIVAANFREPRPERRQVILPTLEGFEVLRMEEIVRLQGNGNYTDVFLRDGSKKVACRFLKHYAEILPLPFLRVHRSHILNLECVKAYHRKDGGYAVLLDKTEVEVSPQYKEEFLKWFGGM
jgi:two-component system LytT family response regulator